MRWFRAPAAPWLLVSLGLLSTSCVAALGAGAVAVVAGAGAIAYTCYDRVSVTVTDRLTGTTLCDAKVTFLEGTSETVATSCYQAALSKGKYKLRVERQGLETYEVPLEVVRGENCGQTVQTMFVALDRVNRVQPPQQIAPRPSVAPAAARAPAVAPPPASVAPPAAVAPGPAPAAAPDAAAPAAPAPGAAPAPVVPVVPVVPVAPVAPAAPVAPGGGGAPSSSSFPR